MKRLMAIGVVVLVAIIFPSNLVGTKCISFFSNRSDIGPERWGPRRNREGIIVPEKPCGCKTADRCSCLESIAPREAFNKIEGALRVINDPAVEK